MTDTVVSIADQRASLGGSGWVWMVDDIDCGAHSETDERELNI
jgi:hypothetical protein